MALFLHQPAQFLRYLIGAEASGCGMAEHARTPFVAFQALRPERPHLCRHHRRHACAEHLGINRCDCLGSDIALDTLGSKSIRYLAASPMCQRCLLARESRA